MPTEPAHTRPASELPRSADVVIVGAGLAGLAAAHELAGHDLDVVVIEASDRVGGRVTSDVVDGVPFRFDRGFQLYNPAYPAGRDLLDYTELELQPFAAGVIARIGADTWRIGDPRRLPSWALSSARAPIGPLTQRVRLARYALRTASTPVAELEKAPDVTTAQALCDARIDGELVERILAPFLRGVFLEPDLATSRRFADLVLRSFVNGSPALPRHGMQAIPEQLARRLPQTPIVLNCRATAVTSAGIETERGRIAAPNVIVAADASTATTLLGLAPVAFNGCTTWYFQATQAARELADGRGALVVDGEQRGPVQNAFVLNNVVMPAQHQNESGIVAATTLRAATGSPVAEDSVRRHLATLFGNKSQPLDTSGWSVVAHYDLPAALPQMRPPFDVRRPVRLERGRYVAGDHRDTSSIQGALASGRRAARALLRDTLPLQVD